MPLYMQRYDPSASSHEPKRYDFTGLDTTSAHGDPLHCDTGEDAYIKLGRGPVLSGMLPAAANHVVWSTSFKSKPDHAIKNGLEPSAASELLSVEISQRNADDLTSEAFETFEEMNSRHRREYDDLQRRITQKMYLATDKTRQDIHRQCDELERRLKKRQYMETPFLVDANTRNRRISKQLRAEESKDHAAAISNIDSELQWMETENALLHTLEAKERDLGPDHISTIDTVKNAGRVYFDQGKLVEAEAMFLRALHGYQNATGPTQVLINGVKNNLGRIYYRQGNMNKAEDMYIQALASFERYLGSTHPTTRNTANRLGHVYQKQGKLQEAERLFEQSMNPMTESSKDLVKNGSAVLDHLQLGSNRKDDLTGTRKFTGDNIRELGKAFRNNDTSRSASSTNISDTTRWATSEDACLLRTISRIGLEDWPAVSAVVGTKTAEQCHYRYLKFEKSFGIDPTSSDKASQIKFFMSAVEKGSSSELAHWLRNHKDTSVVDDNIVLQWDESGAKLKEGSLATPSTSGPMSPAACKSISDHEMPHGKNTTDIRTLVVDPFKNPQIESDIAINAQWDQDSQEELHGKAMALFDFKTDSDNELTMVEGQVVDILCRHGQGWLVAEDSRTKKSGLVPEGYICMLHHLVQGIDSQDIEEKLTASATDLAKTILGKSPWLDRMEGSELELAVTILGNEVRSKLHGQGWPRTTLEMHREVHMETFRDLLVHSRNEQGLQPLKLSPSLKTRDDININPHASLFVNEAYDPDDQSENSFDFSATESVVSVADSIFSAISLTTGSSMSSLSVSQTATDRLVRLLLEDTVIKPLCEDALRENGLSRERFERNLSRLLKGFAVELRKEAQTRGERQAAHLVRFRARNSAHMICSTLRTEKEEENTKAGLATAPHSNIEKDEPEGDMDVEEDSDGLSESSEDTPDDFQHLENFVKDSKAFQSFRENLRAFIHPQKAHLTTVSTSTVASRRDSLCSNPNALATALPEMLEDVNEDSVTVSDNLEASNHTSVFMALSELQVPANLNLETFRKVYQPISQMLELLASAIKTRKRPPVAHGKTRIEWSCKCGQKLYDDFTELRPGAASRLEQALSHSDSSGTNIGRGSTFGSYTGSLWSSFSSISKLWASNSSRKSLESGLPTREPPKSQLDPSNPNAVEPTPLPVELLYLLLCYPSGRYATRLLQLDLHNLEPKSDQSLFTILRSNYKSMRGQFFSLISLKTLKSIKFVHFEMYRSSLIDVRQKDVIPPPNHIEYRYSPAPSEVIPPVGDNHLMHLFLHPDHADEDTVCLDRFPKKLKEKLCCKKGQPTNFGWGLEFVEGWDMKSIWIISFVIFGIGSLLLGILWAVYKHSIQDAFAIAGYMVSFTAVSVGAIQSLLVM
ncbi:hypothetical protein OCU04_012388 [Sclerotinia nivalis]|uniref:Nephrocystin-3 n=1 Tax=Sclerotinia nivalis TaxID=352851 RepID=A0A9X0DCW4_9HELO|nr:hypothetical protein OCU04_012388 [Sclerotinia nivalis]